MHRDANTPWAPPGPERIEDAMRRDTAAPQFWKVPFCGLRLFAVDGVLRIAILRLVSRGVRFCAWFFACSLLVLGGFLARRFVTCNFDDLQMCVRNYAKSDAKIIENRSGMVPKSVQNRPKWCPGAPRTCNVQRATRQGAKGSVPHTDFADFWRHLDDFGRQWGP